MPGDNKKKGKILIRGQIECLSSVHVGNGRDEKSDLDIIRDGDGKPIIPATSFVGILRHYFEKYLSNGESEQDINNFWGYSENDEGQQSALCCSNLTLMNEIPANVIVRDGVRINNETGLADDKGKFDFELLERGARFKLEMELTYNNSNEAFVKKTVRTIYELLSNGQIYIGAKTNSGFGQISLVGEQTGLYLFDFTSKGCVLNWLTRKFLPENKISVTELCEESFSSDVKRFSIAATLRLKSSLLIRSYANAPEMPDAAQLQSNEDWVVPGTSIKGAIRTRAERIANTLELKDAQDIIHELFGFVAEEIKQNEKAQGQNQQSSASMINRELYKKKGRKGKLRVHEIVLSPNDFPAELQTRIKIDRFTGGVIEGALFDSMPVYAPQQHKMIKLHIEIVNYNDREAGLMLLVLKDLWSGDLAIGGEKNIGRGAFQGVRSEVAWGEKPIIFEDDISLLEEEEKMKLQDFVDALFEEQE